MTSRTSWAALLLGVATAGIAVCPPAQAQPLTPLAPNEIHYLEQLRRVFAVSRNPTSFRSDGELLTLGRYACDERRAGLVGSPVTYVDPVVTQLAFISLCPQ
jgi:hypothetical protein